MSVLLSSISVLEILQNFVIYQGSLFLIHINFHLSFCGESENIVLEEYVHTSGKRWEIYCCNCMAGIDRGYDQSPHGLIDAWNKRV